MSQQRRFEGPDVRALLDEICSTYGTEPRIARAETFRAGGVLGFFAKEHYRLVVDEADLPAVAAAAGPVASVPAAAVPVAAVPVSAVPVSAVPATTGGQDGDLEELFASLAESTVDDTELTTTAPAVAAALAGTTDDGTFESILTRVARMVDSPAAAPVTWPEADPAAEIIPAYRPPAIGAPATPASEPAPAQAADRPAAIDAVGLTFQTAEAPAAPIPAWGAPPVDGPMAARPVARRERTPLAAALYKAGLHPDDIERVEEGRAGGGAVEALLLEVMDSHPTAPRLPRRPGSLVAVVGPGSRATAEASRIAAEVGSDPAGVALATTGRRPRSVPEELLVRRAEDAMDLASGHRRGRVGVVAVDAVGAPTAVWARHILDALRPTLVLAVIDAMHKTEDVAAWIEALGGVDAVIVDNLDATVSPARVLDLGVPVSRIGDAPSTPARWAATVADRVAGTADERPEAAPDPVIEPADDDLGDGESHDGRLAAAGVRPWV